MVHYSEGLFDSIIYLVRLGSEPPVFKKLYCFYDILANAIEGSSARLSKKRKRLRSVKGEKG